MAGHAEDTDIIVASNVNKWYGEFHALKNVSLTVKRREVVVIIGPSGSGKSTFIRTINRLEEHQSGDISVDGIPLTRDVRNIEAIRQFMQWATGVRLMDPKVYFFHELPAEVDFAEATTVVVMALVLTLLATLYPSWRASRLDPVEALRYE